MSIDHQRSFKVTNRLSGKAIDEGSWNFEQISGRSTQGLKVDLPPLVQPGQHLVRQNNSTTLAKVPAFIAPTDLLSTEWPRKKSVSLSTSITSMSNQTLSAIYAI
ncbi:hypothetical protein TNCV_3636451 [Trichonephila clavipes]|nr:hypothetical protein TNCV_3636451 [Trichonephila clavipes]